MRLPSVQYMHIQNKTVDVDPEQDEGYISYGGAVTAECMHYICDEPGEYHHNAMLICPPTGPIQSMPLPIVAHQRSNYEVVKKQGILWVTQKNVGFEDFT